MSDDLPAKPLLEQFLADRDAACPACRTNLHRLKADRCPGCGRKLELAVEPIRSSTAWAIAGLAAIGAGVGFNALALAFFLWQIYRVIPFPDTDYQLDYYVHGNTGGHTTPMITTLAVGLAVSAMLLAAWIVLWRRGRRIGPLMAAWCWLVLLGNALAVVVNYAVPITVVLALTK